MPDDASVEVAYLGLASAEVGKNYLARGFIPYKQDAYEVDSPA